MFKQLGLFERNVVITDFAKCTKVETPKSGPGGSCMFKVSHGKLTLEGDSTTKADAVADYHIKSCLRLLELVLYDASSWKNSSIVKDCILAEDTPYAKTISISTRGSAPFTRLINHKERMANAPTSMQKVESGWGPFNGTILIPDILTCANSYLDKYNPGAIVEKYKKFSGAGNVPYLTLYLPYLDYRGKDGNSRLDDINSTCKIIIRASEFDAVMSKSTAIRPSTVFDTVTNGPNGTKIPVKLVRPWEIFGSSEPNVKPLPANCMIFSKPEIFIGQQKNYRTVVGDVWFGAWIEISRMQVPDMPVMDEPLPEDDIPAYD